jgi:hypothetical protein
VTARRISRGTPYILTNTEVEEILKHLPARIETAVAALMNLTVDDWHKQPAKLRAKQIIDFQNAGAFAATMAAAEKAIGDLEAAAVPTIQRTDMGELMESLIEELHRRGLIVINPSTVKQGN